MRKRLAWIWTCAAAVLWFVSPAGAQIKAVATLPDLGMILKTVGGDRVRVHTVARGDQDPHYVPAKPSLLRKFRGARFLVYNGMELEIGWLPLLLQGARNPRLRSGSPGVFNASSSIGRALEVPAGQLSRAQGDIHPEGNPHYTLDPRNGVRVAKALAERLGRLDAGGVGVYRANAKAFADRLSGKIKGWEERLAPYRGREVVTYHRVWSYFFDWAGLQYAGVIEDKPGIPASPIHVTRLVKTMRARDVRTVFVANYTPPRVARRLAKRAGARVVILPAQAGAEGGAETYEAWMDSLVAKVTGGLKQGK